MHRLARIAAAALLLAGIGACAHKPDATPAQPEAAPATKATPALAEDGLTLEGVLAYTPLPRAMSVEAYMGVEFTLTDEEGVAHVLSASDDVPSEALQAQDGNRVHVRCVMQPAAAPAPDESSPMGPDGEPLKRPARCRVKALSTH